MQRRGGGGEVGLNHSENMGPHPANHKEEMPHNESLFDSQAGIMECPFCLAKSQKKLCSQGVTSVKFMFVSDLLDSLENYS